MTDGAKGAGGSRGEGGGVARPFDPVEFEAAGRQGGAYRGADMRPPLGPIEAGAAEYAAFGACRREIDAEIREEIRPRSRHFAGLLAQYHELALAQPFGKSDAEQAGDVIVAGAGVPELIVELR